MNLWLPCGLLGFAEPLAAFVTATFVPPQLQLQHQETEVLPLHMFLPVAQ
jgi:hypothetical protein